MFSYFIQTVKTPGFGFADISEGAQFDTLRDAYKAAIPDEALLPDAQNHWHVLLFPEVCKRISSLQDTRLLIAYAENSEGQKLSQVFLLSFPMT